jgi:pimeloyl-ACP methyl ester carboxylesterase
MRSLISIALFSAAFTSGFVLPDPPGRYNVTLTTGTLTDYTRHNSDGVPRALMLSVFQPATCTSTIPASYMPNKTAIYMGPFLQQRFELSVDLTPLFMDARLPVCASDESHCAGTVDYPILLFSPGWSMSRLIYSVLASAISSEGFIVITIDHPDETAVITYPDGHSIYHESLDVPTTEEFTNYMFPHAVDSSFIIDQLSNATAMAELLPQRGTRSFSTDRVAMFGHSLGGSASTYAVGQDSRIRAAINWDGTLFGDLPSKGVSQPVLFMSRPGPSDGTFDAAWPNLNGPKLWVQVANLTHMGFSDALPLFGAAGLDAPELTDLLGNIQSLQLVKMLATYTAEWMKGAFAGNMGGPLLQGEETHMFPEVSILMKGNY